MYRFGLSSLAALVAQLVEYLHDMQDVVGHVPPEAAHYYLEKQAAQDAPNVHILRMDYSCV